ncbi:hypothetical protein ACMGGR_18860 [Erwinia sp. BNK-24-b]|uniref:hypothetical protein n=1 Tax=unclassified Erwinia TaxID=2622719 RepID=UPI0039BF94A8
MKRSILAARLGLTEEELDEMDLDAEDLDEGKVDEEKTTFYFNVPDNTPQHILGKKGWSIGDRVEVPIDLFNLNGE